MNHLVFYFQQLEQQSGGALGVSALHLESDRQIHYHGDEMFLLCSTYKIPIALTLLQMVDQGLVHLNDLIPITEYDLRPGSGSFLWELDYGAPVQLSVLNLLKLMMQYSCNSSTDIILNLIGGTSAVKRFLHDLNIENLHIDSSTLEAIADWDGVTDLPENGKLKLSEYQQLSSTVDPKLREIHRAKSIQDQKNKGSPNSMINLLQKFLSHEIVSPPLIDLLLKIMQRCKTAPHRMMSRLPKNIIVSRKTGTLTGFVNEVAVIQMPFNLGHLILGVYISGSNQTIDICENIIAETARFIFDYYVLNSERGDDRRSNAAKQWQSSLRN